MQIPSNEFSRVAFSLFQIHCKVIRNCFLVLLIFSLVFFFTEFQKVPSIEVTANKFLTNFLFTNPMNTRGKSQAGTLLIDNVIVMDGSGSVGVCEFKRGKAAIKNMMKSANAVAVKNKYDEKYAAVTFSTSARVNFKFLPYSTAEQKLSMIQFPSDSTNTQAGLAEAMKLFVESLTGICFAVTKFPPVRKLCGNFPEIPFTEVLKV